MRSGPLQVHDISISGNCDYGSMFTFTSSLGFFNMQESAFLRAFLGGPKSPLTIRISICQCEGSSSLLHLYIACHLSITHLFSGIGISQYNRILFLAA